MTEDFLALLDRRERSIVVLLKSGYTQAEVARLVGFANHSGVSKALAKIRRRALAYFDGA